MALDFNKKKEIKEIRTPGSLKTRWVVVQRVTQKYIAAEKLSRFHMRSGATEEMVEDRAMQVYCDRNGTMKNGVKQIAPVIKFMEAVRYLKTQPKFSTAIGGSASHSGPGSSTGGTPGSSYNGPLSSSFMDPEEGANYASSVSEDLPSGNIPISSPATQSPSGVKSQKIEAAIGNGSVNVARFITKVSDAIRFSARAKANATAVALELKILRAMYLSEEDYNQKLEALLRRTQMLQNISSSGNNGDLSTVPEHEGMDGSSSGGGVVHAHEDTAIASARNKEVAKFNDANEEPPSKE